MLKDNMYIMWKELLIKYKHYKYVGKKRKKRIKEEKEKKSETIHRS